MLRYAQATLENAGRVFTSVEVFSLSLENAKLDSDSEENRKGNQELAMACQVIRADERVQAITDQLKYERLKIQEIKRREQAISKAKEELAALLKTPAEVVVAQMESLSMHASDTDKCEMKCDGQYPAEDCTVVEDMPPSLEQKKWSSKCEAGEIPD